VSFVLVHGGDLSSRSGAGIGGEHGQPPAPVVPPWPVFRLGASPCWRRPTIRGTIDDLRMERTFVHLDRLDPFSSQAGLSWPTWARCRGGVPVRERDARQAIRRIANAVKEAGLARL